jgi:hypothetical protein
MRPSMRDILSEATLVLTGAASPARPARATTPPGTCTAAEGLDAETFRGFQLAGELFLLTSFFGAAA